MTSRADGPWMGDAVAAEVAALDAADERLLALVARLPLAPVGVLLPFLDAGPSTIYQHLRGLCRHGVLGSITTPLPTSGRPARLFQPTPLGLAVLAQRGLAAVASPGRQQRSGAPRRLLLDLPGRLALYELLALLAGSGPGVASLAAWECPWRRRLPTFGIRADAARVVRLPAAATLAWDGPDEMATHDYLLLADTGGMALPAMRGTLGRLAEYQAASRTPPTLVIGTTSPRRAEAWAALLDLVCQTRRRPAFPARVATWADLRRAAGLPASTSPSPARPPTTRRYAPSSEASPPGDSVSPGTGPRPARARMPLPRRGPAARGAGLVLGPFDRAVLDLVGRHAFLPTDLLATLFDRDRRWARTRRARLRSQSLLRVLPAEEVTPPELARRGLLELTCDGLLVLAAQLGLPPAAAVRHHGLAGGGLVTPVGPRAALLAHLPHTLGADAVFAALARAAHTYPGGGALLEWRSAAACAHGRLRPDGYGLLRLGQQQHGFFVEFDRGSMRPGRLRAKFAAYHRYRASVRSARAYDGFPVILVVTTGPGPERRLAQAIRAADVFQATPLPALLTTTGLLGSVPGGPLGRVWRTAADPARRSLVSGTPAAGHPAGWLHRVEVVR